MADKKEIRISPLARHSLALEAELEMLRDAYQSLEMELKRAKGGCLRTNFCGIFHE